VTKPHHKTHSDCIHHTINRLIKFFCFDWKSINSRQTVENIFGKLIVNNFYLFVVQKYLIHHEFHWQMPSIHSLSICLYNLVIYDLKCKRFCAQNLFICHSFLTFNIIIIIKSFLSFNLKFYKLYKNYWNPFADRVLLFYYMKILVLFHFIND